ncbi:Cache 3/Cache 2 fusion domain-containing protein [Undibacterium sp. FT147W]|uniref:Cache 3/Cache 2 fusion domain-containing protein n=1 Tax=Undibacterium rivi TaxID=2828729 RepID=A0ABS5H0P6_9BURK|nr:Cache 3/Cache 2 fusion domain-containing protein [Undibacterium rivi]MBR7792281.1 Cache 3/Cache 2 fusion domain-containing protein [Undibacterium rivi]
MTSTKQKKLGQLLGLSVFSGAFLVLIIFTSAVALIIHQSLEKSATQDITNLLNSVNDSFEVFDNAVKADAERTGDNFRAELGDQFTVEKDKKVDVAGKNTPSLKLDDKVINNNFDIVDGFTARTGAIATFFVKDDSDFIRVSTSLKKENGERAIGTALDKNHPAYNLLLDGKRFTGTAKLFGKNYMTYYNPFMGQDGKVAGVIFIGINIEPTLGLLKDKIKAMKIGKTGYFYAFDKKDGKQQGNLMIHPVKEGENILDSRTADGQLFVKSMIEKKEGTIRYDWINSEKGETKAKEKLVVFRSIPSVNWILAGGVYSSELAEESMSQVLWLGGLATVLLIIGGILFLILVRKVVTVPLQQATTLAESLAVGDLSRRVETASNNEIGHMLQAMNGIGEGLSKVVAEVRSGSANIQIAAQEIASGNADLSSRTEVQAGTLEETASSMEELTSTVHQNAANAKEANRFVSSASEVATQAGTVVNRMVETMVEIRDSSKKVEDIINVINGIAFQTNILALNAAVEAARAGEQGRGFAVVAGEVRNLAQRASAAAKDIQSLINDSVKKVESGSVMADEAGRTMGRVVEDIHKVTTLVNEISHASVEQSAGINQVNDAISNMDEMTQQNSALVEQAAAAAESMREQSDKLSALVAQFRTRDQTQPMASAPHRKILPALT